MSDSDAASMSVEAAFADAAQAERAVVQLQERGVPADQIEVEHGATAAPGRTAAADEQSSTRLVGSWWTGIVAGALIGGLIGAVIGLFTGGLGSGIFWGLALGCGGAGAGLGALYGMFAGFAGRSTGTHQFDENLQPELTDAVRLLVQIDGDDLDAVRRIVRDAGGALL